MKKIIALCLALTLCLYAFAGCSGGGASSSGGSSSGEGATSESSASQAETGSTNEAPYEVNFAYIVASTGSNMDKVREAVNELALEELLTMGGRWYPGRYEGGESVVPEKVRDCDFTDLAEKKMILARLRAYREKHGLGCWKRLARGKVTEELLRGVLADARLLTRREWRAIGRALDKAEEQEVADGKGN